MKLWRTHNKEGERRPTLSHKTRITSTYPSHTRVSSGIESTPGELDHLADTITARVALCRRRYGSLYDAMVDQAHTALLMEMQRQSGRSPASVAVEMAVSGRLTEFVGDQGDAFHFLVHAALLMQRQINQG